MEKIIGIMGAMPEEIDEVVALLQNCRELQRGMRTYYSGHINGIKTIVVFSRWGKVAAATTVTSLIHEFNITELLFTGVAGAIHPNLKIGDIVVAERLIQHDMDARPLMKQHEIPLLSKTFFEIESPQLSQAVKAINVLLENRVLHSAIENTALEEFNITHPALHTGDIASGDQFFSTNQQKQLLNTLLPGVLCVEMEGAAAAQVCYEHGIPLSVIRTISDTSDENSHINFPAFIQKIARRYSVEIIKHIYEHF